MVARWVVICPVKSPFNKPTNTAGRFCPENSFHAFELLGSKVFSAAEIGCADKEAPKSKTNGNDVEGENIENIYDHHKTPFKGRSAIGTKDSPSPTRLQNLY